VLTISLSHTKDLCEEGTKCVRKDQHEGECWPKDEEEEA
jgi:hypothetical protein